MRRAVLPMLLLVLAGCVTAPASTEERAAVPGPAGLLPFPDPMGHDHDHSDPTIHASAWNFEQTFHHPLAGSETHSSGVHALDVKAGFLFAALYGGDADAEGGFFVFDLADPAQPREVGRYRFPGPLGGDRSMEANEDAEFVALGTEYFDCGGRVNPVAPGLYLIDVRDKSSPTVASYVPSRTVHSVAVHRIGGDDYVFAMMAGKNVFRVDRSLPVVRLVEVAEIPIGHDMFVMDDPLLGKPLLYAANGPGGFVVWDVSEPARPRQVAEWNIPDRPDGKYYVHTGHVAIVEGRRIAVVTSEDWG
ncbi:MAG TPA: hypothetical protein VHH36_05500, partial [Candidatus Thermoplasmatota archaeon]|nr:hypothetical protein [Candidatus Thermoplasmatota archaeon]